jgi:hypothetical protein
VAVGAVAAVVAGTVTVTGTLDDGQPQPAMVPAASGAGSPVAHYAYVQTDNHGATYHMVTAGGYGCCHRAVTSFPVLGRPSYSPDGQKLAFSGPLTDGSDGRYVIYVVNTNGTGLRRLTITRFADRDPAWSPDGRTIAFSRETVGFGVNTFIGLINADGSGVRAVSGTTGGIMPSWSPDSGSLTYAAPDGIHVISAAGGTSRLIVRGNVGDPAWSPDGQRIAFVRHDAEASDTVAVVNAGGGTVTPVESIAGSAETPAWSADGTTVHWLDYLGEGEEGRTLTAVWKVQLGHSPTFVFTTPSPQLHMAVYPGGHGPLPRTIVGIRSATDNSLLVRRQDASSFRSLAGPITSAPTIVSAGGVAYYFAQGTDGNVWGRTDQAGWARVGPAGATCASPAAAVIGSTLTLDCRNGSNMLTTGTATLTGSVPSIASFSVVGGPIVGGPGLGVVNGRLTTVITGPTRSDGNNVLLASTGGGLLAIPLYCSGSPSIAGWPPASGWIACVSRGGALTFDHQHSPGHWTGPTTIGSGWVGSVGVACRPDGYATLFLQGTDKMIRRFDTLAFTTISYGPAASGGAGAAEIVTP